METKFEARVQQRPDGKRYVLLPGSEFETGSLLKLSASDTLAPRSEGSVVDFRVSTTLAPGEFSGPHLRSVAPDPFEAGVTVFEVAIKYHGAFHPSPPTYEAIKGVKNLVALEEAVRGEQAAKEAMILELFRLKRRKEQLEEGLRRLDELVARRVYEESRDAHVRANAAEKALREMKKALRTLGLNP